MPYLAPTLDIDEFVLKKEQIPYIMAYNHHPSLSLFFQIPVGG